MKESGLIKYCSDDVFCRPAWKFASPRFPQQKNLDFWVIAENKLPVASYDSCIFCSSR